MGGVNAAVLSCPDRPVVKTSALRVGCWLVACLLAQRPSNMPVSLRDGSALISLGATTLRQTLQVKLSNSPSQSILTPGQPVPALTV